MVATPGAEPVADGGYAAVVLLDTWLMLGLAHLRAEEEALRRWSNAVGLVRPGGRAVVVGDPAHPALQALVRWDQAGFAEREAEARREAHLPPASRLATITGEPGAVDDVLTLLTRPEGTEVLGPVPVDGSSPARSAPSSGCRAAQGAALSDALGEVQRVRSARKLDAGPHPGRPADPVTLPRLHGVIVPIRLFGDPVLRSRAIEVVDFDKELRRLVEDLTDTMLDAPGAGLAAPQIGVGLRVFTWYVDDEVGHLVNPTLTLSEETQDGAGGLPVDPRAVFDCRRALSVVAHGFDMHGEPVVVEGTELLARAIQHETDHLDGVLFVDRLDREARRAAMKAIREAEWFAVEQPTVKAQPARDRRAGPLRAAR